MGGAIVLLRSAACMIVLSTTSACASGDSGQPASTDGARQPQVTGREVSGTRVSLPAIVQRAAPVSGRAPPGSRVETDGQVLTVDGSGTFQLQAPASAGNWNVRVVRPAPMSPLTIKVRVTHGDN